MEAPSMTGLQSLRTVTIEEGKTFCKCGEGWTCEFTKTEPSKAGKPFCTSGDSATSCCFKTPSAVGEGSTLDQTIETATGGNVVVKCGEGWTCTITKTDGPDSGKAFFQCGNGCDCVIDGTTSAAKFVCAC